MRGRRRGVVLDQAHDKLALIVAVDPLRPALDPPFANENLRREPESLASNDQGHRGSFRGRIDELVVSHSLAAASCNGM
jgi:hypothetical protein